MRICGRLKSDTTSVSPVIAVVLMVAITVVLASVVYIMVSGMIVTVPSSQRLGVTETRYSENWTISLVYVPSGLTPNNTYFQTFGPDGSPIIPRSLLKDVQGFRDKNPVGLLNPGDRIILSISSHPDHSTFDFISGNTVIATGSLGG